MKVNTVSIEYTPGEYSLTNGHNKYERGHHNKAGRYVNPTGFGWATESKPSRITVWVDVNEKCEEVWVDRFFKDNWGKLTVGRVEAIKSTLPDEIVVEKNTSCTGGVYYTADDKSMYAWLNDAKAAR